MARRRISHKQIQDIDSEWELNDIITKLEAQRDKLNGEIRGAEAVIYTLGYSSRAGAYKSCINSVEVFLNKKSCNPQWDKWITRDGQYLGTSNYWTSPKDVIQQQIDDVNESIKAQQTSLAEMLSFSIQDLLSDGTHM